MNLSWIVALLRPRDLLMGRSEEENNAACQLAALVLGEPLYLHRFPMDSGTADLGVRFAAQSLDPSEIREGLAGLVHQVVEEPGEDIARACALGLMASCAAAEIEDYSAGEIVLQSLLDRLEPDSNHSVALLRVLVLQQMALRMRDTGRDPESVSTEALTLLGAVTPDSLAPCRLGKYANFTVTADHMISALRHAIWSLAPWSEIRMGRVGRWSNFPSRELMLMSPKSELVTKVRADRADIYAKFVQQTFRNRFGSRTRYVLGGPDVPDMFSQSLALELIGHASVRESRKELALLRLVQIDSYEQSEHVKDTLRLLRHSEAYKELSLAVERFRVAGPLWALSEDARQIIERRTGLYTMGRSELRVLRGAADLMTTAEANRALVAVQGWSNESHIGEAWLTAATLAFPAKKTNDVADLILHQVETHKQKADYLGIDLARAVRALNWSDMHSKVREQWGRWLKRSGDLWPAAAESISGFLDADPDDTRPLPDLDSVAVRLNRAINGNSMPPSAVQRSVELVTQGLHALISEARGGSYSMKYPSAADIAAALIIFNGVDLWQDLATCLADPQISRHDTNNAFERLAHERPPIHAEAADLLRESALTILGKRDRFLDSPTEVTPYPEALRFLAAYQLIDDGMLFSSVAQLAGNRSSAIREQAARTVATIAEVRRDTWILAVAIQLSHDHDVSVRSHAGRALALLAGMEDLEPRVSEARVVELLGEDGIAIPIRLLNAMKNHPPTDSEIKGKVEQLMLDHPALSIRSIAAQVVQKYS
ncbi:hypothetical protein ACIQ9K_31155 [Streptomyces microflavus]|uniref:hypothetical protein n=1 Tax=Streptomyces microflavus TaxID=1919 RepID=UPI003811972B